MSATELKQTVDEIGEAFDAFKKANDQRLDNLEKTGHDRSELKERVESIDEKLASLDEARKKLEKSVVDLSLPDQDDKKEDKAKLEHVKAFEDYVRTAREGVKYGDEEKRQQLIQCEKAVTIGSATAGGHAVPEVISRQIDAKLLDVSEMLPLVKNVNIGTSDYKELVDVKGATSGWVGERGGSPDYPRTETSTPSLEQVAPTIGIVYAYPMATEESLQDIFFNVQDWLVNSAVEAFDIAIGNAIIAGNGVNKPTGFLNGTPVNIADDDSLSPQRAFGTLQYLPTGVADGLPAPFNLNSSPQIPDVQGDFLLDIIYSLKKGYRRNARWLMNKATLAAVRKFRDADGQYLWQPGLQMGQPSRLMDYPLNEMEDMPDIGTNTFPMAFGDFRAGYTFVNRAGMSMTIDDNITTPGYVKFYIRKRVGGILRNDDAIKLAKCAVS